MRILVALIAVFMVSVAVAQMPPKKPTTDTAVLVCVKDAANNYKCTDPKTGKTQKVKCKNPPKQKLPPKLSMAQLAEVCGLLDENGFPYRRAGD